MRKTCRERRLAAGESHDSDCSLKFHQVYFVLDEEFRLLWVGGDWDEFALSNGGEKARSNEVLSTSLLTHIVDGDTRRVTRSIVEAVVEMQEPFRIDYRCDSPAVMRRFHMTVQPMKDNRVLVVHDLRDARTFDPPLTPWRHDPQAPDFKCTFCHAVRQEDGPWHPPETLAENHPTAVSFTVCEPCEALVDEALQALRANRKPSGQLTKGFGPGSAEE